MTAAALSDDAAAALKGASWVGFDLDHALVRYKVENLMALIWRCLVSNLVDCHADKYGCLAAELDDAAWASWARKLAAKDVVFDFRFGDLLRVDAGGAIRRAFHGRRQLSEAEIAAKYDGATWDLWPVLRRAEKRREFFYFVTYFDTPAAPLFAHLVERLDAAAGAGGAGTAPVDYSSMRGDVFDSFDATYGFEQCVKLRGGFFPAIAAEPDKYVERRPGLRAWLEEVRDERPRRLYVFLATNSHISFTRILLAHAFGDGWERLFDLLIVNAQKPLFFSTVRPFYTLAGGHSGCSEGEIARSLAVHPPRESGRNGDIVCQGHAAIIEEVARLVQANSGEAPTVIMDATGELAGGLHHHLSVGEMALFDAGLIEEEAAAAAEGTSGGDSGPSDTRSGPVSIGSLHRVMSGLPTEPVAVETTPKFIYVGDHIHGDVRAASKHCSWMTVAVVEELEDHHDRLVTAVDGAADASAHDHSPPPAGRFTGQAETWGSLFDIDGDASHFSTMLREHATVAVADAAAIPALLRAS